MIHPAFDMFFAALVALNTVFMGVDVEMEIAAPADHEESVALSVIRGTFTVAFTATWLSGWVGADLD